ncbi:MAG: DUF4173 domain-containing protein [Oscillospiraceae bacterium]|nr:DUF4173 domain-containing protein [Oscillospiraceae bacterium]
MNETASPPLLLPAAPEKEPPRDTPLHQALHQYRRYFLLLAGTVGAAWSACFTEAGGLGLNAMLYALVWCVCGHLALKRLGLADLRRDGKWYAGIMLLALAVFWTANRFLQYVSIVGAVLLQCFWLLDVFARVADWHFGKAARAVLMLPFRALARCMEPWKDLFSLRGERAGRFKYVLLGLLIAAPLVALVTGLLSEADAVFSRMVSDLFAYRDLPEHFWTVLRAVAWAALAGTFFYAALCAQTAEPEPQGQDACRQADTLVAVTFTAALAAVYLVFCFVQVTVLFTGNADALPQNYTYAQYAREGFFELLAVSAINVLLVIVSQRRFKSSRTLRFLLCLISGCTVLMEVSSAWRMILYVRAYGLTFLRVLVLWFLGVLAIVLTGAVITVFRPNFRLFRFSLAVCLAAWLLLCFARPDALAARYDLQRFGCKQNIMSTIRYEMSKDALSELQPYLDTVMDTSSTDLRLYLKEYIPAKYREAGVRGFNYSLWRANLTVEEYLRGE